MYSIKLDFIILCLDPIIMLLYYCALPRKTQKTDTQNTILNLLN